MAKEEVIKLGGTIVEALPSTRYKVKLENDHVLMCTISGKIRKHNIRVLLGDSVQVEMSPYDLTLGRIVFRDR